MANVNNVNIKIKKKKIHQPSSKIKQIQQRDIYLELVIF